MDFKYKKQVPLEERQKISRNILEKDRIPLVCEPDPKCKLNIYGKTHFLVPYEMTVAQFGHILRKKINMLYSQQLMLLSMKEEVKLQLIQSHTISIYSSDINLI